MATNTSDFFTFSKTAGTAKNLQKPTDGGDNNLWGGYINVDLDTIVGAVNATSDLIADANQNELVDFTATGSAVNHVGITNAATGNGPTIEAKGDDTNIDLNVSGKGTGKLATTSPKITTGINDSNNNELIKVTATGSAVNEITVANAATGNGPTLSATGDDTNIDLNIAGKGSGTAKFTSNIIIPDAGNIGSVSDPDAIAIASDGGLTFNGGIDNSGTISAGTIGGSVVFPAGGTGNAISIAIVYEQLSNGTDAGDATSGSWQKRNINTEISDTDSIVSIGTDNKITLGAGSYFFQFGAGAYKVGQHQTRLYNTTGSATVAMGTSAYGDSGVNIVTPSIGFGYHAPSSSNVYELNHRFQDDKTGNGLGVSNSFGINEVYSFIVIYKLK